MGGETPTSSPVVASAAARRTPVRTTPNHRSAIDARTTRHPGYRVSTIKRKRIEEFFGWMKTIGGLRKTRHRGRGLVEWFLVLTASAYILVRIQKLLVTTG